MIPTGTARPRAVGPPTDRSGPPTSHPVALYRPANVVAMLASALLLSAIWLVAGSTPAGGQVPSTQTTEPATGSDPSNEPATGSDPSNEPATQPTAEPDRAAIGGTISHADGRPAVGAKAALYTATPEAARDGFLRPAFTGPDGSYLFTDLAADCYIVVLTGPDGTTFDDGTDERQHHTCVDPGQTDDSVSGVLSEDTDDTDGTGATPEDADSAFDLHILHMGDHYSHLEATSMELLLGGRTIEIEVGGLPRVVAKIEERTEALGDDRVVKIHAGGALTGTIYYAVFGGAADAALLNATCFDVLTLDRHDVERGDSLDAFLGFLGDGGCGTELLGPDGRPDAPWADSWTTVVDGRTLGFVAVSPDLDPATPAEARIPAIQARVDALSQQDVRHVVLLSRLGLTADRALTAGLTGVDVVIGGGSKSLLGDFDSLGLEPAGPYPIQAIDADGETVCLAHAWHHAAVVGELDVGFDDLGRVVRCGGVPHLLLGAPRRELAGRDGAETDGRDAERSGRWQPVSDETMAAVESLVAARPELSIVAIDPEAETTLDGYRRALEELDGEVIGTVTDDLCLTGIPGRTVGILCGFDVLIDTTDPRSDVQRLVADSLRSQAGGSAVAIIDSGSIRSEIAAGPFAIRDVYRLLPDGHTLTYLQMTGSEIAAVLEQAIEATLSTGWSSDPYPHTSGLRWKPDLERPQGRRVGPIEVLDGVGGWQPLDPDAVYRVVSTDFLAGGGRGYEAMAAVRADGRAVDTPIEYAQTFVDYVVGRLERIIPPPAIDPTSPPSSRSQIDRDSSRSQIDRAPSRSQNG